MARAVSWIVLGTLLALAVLAAATPSLILGGDHTAQQFAAAAIFVGSYAALAMGKIPGMLIDRAGVALVAAGALPLDDAYKAIDLDTITLLLGMMIVVANLRLSGFFAVANAWVAARVGRPAGLLAAVVLVSGVFSAFLVNDAICLVLAPLVADLAKGLRRNPVPYLLAVALASNIGSAATITGNPQNIMIGSLSGIPYMTFGATLAPVALAGLALTFILLILLYRREFLTHERLDPTQPVVRFNRVLLARSTLATLAVVGLFFAGQPPAKAAIVVGALLLLTRRVRSTRVYAEIDWSLLLMFSGLFIIVAGAEHTLLTPDLLEAANRSHLDRPWVLSAVTAVLSNVVSNVPAVLMLKPFVATLPDPTRGWFLVAVASTLAGNFTVLGSVANLIVIEKAARRGVAIGFWAYARIGMPLTLMTLLIGIWWLSR
jgi:Na+/H+ antiporter NhaD/arsenite permease-like protein